MIESMVVHLLPSFNFVDRRHSRVVVERLWSTSECQVKGSLSLMGLDRVWGVQLPDSGCSGGDEVYGRELGFTGVRET